MKIWAGEWPLLPRLIWALTKRRQTGPRPHFKICLWALVASTLRPQEKERDNKFESLPTQLRKKEDHSLKPTQKMVDHFQEKTLKDDNHSPLPSI